jgi:hypothetical protein
MPKSKMKDNADLTHSLHKNKKSSLLSVKNRTLIFHLAIIILLSLVVSLPAFHENLFRTHEKESLPIRIFEMSNAVADGHLPVRWLPNLVGLYGYPFFNFYAPLSYYVAVFFHLLGFGILFSLKLTIFLGFLSSGIGMYYFARDMFGSKPALISAISYIFVPYHLVDIYVRGDLAEFFCFGFLPLIFLFMHRLAVTKKHKYIVLTSLCYGLLVLTHNITAMLFSFICVGYICYLSVTNGKKIEVFSKLALSLLLGLGLSVFFWLPALLEKKFTNLELITTGYLDIKNHFIYLWQFLDPSFGYGASKIGPEDGMSFQLGLPQILLFGVSLGFVFFNIIKS